MNNSPAVVASRNFLDVVWEGVSPADAELSSALDCLFVAYHETPALDVTFSELDPPDEDWELLYKDVGHRFPDYGMYTVVDPMDLTSLAILMADAIDDIADITSEMRKTVWWAEQLGPEQADKFYRDFYFHWGKHARELSMYLYARQFPCLLWPHN